jgi:hypothetical protein
MEENKLGKEPAFPVEVNVTKPRTTMGISKRFYAACAAMQGCLSNPNVNDHKLDFWVEKAYEVADELLKQE